jgi:hypothetical protein
VGIGQAIAIEEQVRAYGGPKFQLTQQVMNRFSEAVEKAGIDIVPKIAINGQQADGQAGGTNTLFESLLALFLSDKMALDVTPGSNNASSKEAEAIRAYLLTSAREAARPADQA